MTTIIPGCVCCNNSCPATINVTFYDIAMANCGCQSWADEQLPGCTAVIENGSWKWTDLEEVKVNDSFEIDLSYEDTLVNGREICVYELDGNQGLGTMATHTIYSNLDETCVNNPNAYNNELDQIQVILDKITNKVIHIHMRLLLPNDDDNPLRCPPTAGVLAIYCGGGTAISTSYSYVFLGGAVTGPEFIDPTVWTPLGQQVNNRLNDCSEECAAADDYHFNWQAFDVGAGGYAIVNKVA